MILQNTLKYINGLTAREKWLAVLFAALFFCFPTIISISHAAIALILITWLATFSKYQYKEIIQSQKVIWALIMLYAMVLLWVLLAPSPVNWKWTLLHLKKYAIFWYAIIIIILMTHKPFLQKIALYAFMAGMIFILVSTWLNVWFLLPWSASQNLGWGVSHHVFGDYITQNIMMAFFVVIALHNSVKIKALTHKVTWGAICGLSVISITHLSQGRTGAVLLVVALISYISFSVRGKKLVFALLGISVALGLVVASSNIITQRISQAIEEVKVSEKNRTSSIGHRLYNYKTTPILILEKPLLGQGTGAYHTEICRVIEHPDACNWYNWHPHNQFLFFAAEHGLVGISLYVFLLLSLFYTALRSRNRDAAIWLWTLTCILLVDSLFNSPFFSSRENQFFGYMIALFVSMCISQKTSAENQISPEKTLET